MRKDIIVESELAVLVGNSFATILAAMFGAIAGAASTGFAGFDNPSYDPSLFSLTVYSFFIGCCWSVCPIGILASIVLIALLIVGLRLNELRTGFGVIILGIWLIGFFNGAIFSVIITLVAELKATFLSDNTLLCLTIGAGLFTLIIDSLMIVFRYRWLKDWIAKGNT